MKAIAVASVVAAAALVAVGTPAAAASATPEGLTANCLSAIDGDYDETFTGAEGDTFTIGSSNGTCFIAATTGNLFGEDFDGYDGIVTVAGAIPSGGADAIGADATFTIVGSGSFTIRYGTAIAYSSTITVVMVPAPEPGSSGSSIPEWLQAYGRSSADAACEEGWAPSWQSWALPVTGGWVCTRTVPSLGD